MLRMAPGPKRSSARRSSNTRRSIRRSSSTGRQAVNMFTDEDLTRLQGIDGLERRDNNLEVLCGCTSNKVGDSVGKLRVSPSGQFLIRCECIVHAKIESSDSIEIKEKKEKERIFTPKAFEKHARRQGVKKWKSNIWVIMNDLKVPLWKTGLLKYYRHAANDVNWGSATRRKWNFHRDEFVCCSECNKERRFRRKSKDECRAFHDAVANRATWQCADHPTHKIKCGDEEERAGRKSCRGCPRVSTCEGCTSCVCLGCNRCRFLDCNCRTCTDFMLNMEP